MDFDILILTDHKMHTSENSVYALAGALSAHPDVHTVDIASRGQEENTYFFAGNVDSVVSVIPGMPDLTFEKALELFASSATEAELTDYDFILLRLPPPAPEMLFNALIEHVPADHLINAPGGILHTSSKAFLTRFAELCPPMRMVHNEQDAMDFLSEHSLVLKPLSGYGGSGIVRLTESRAEDSQGATTTHSEFFAQWRPPYLAMEFLNRVTEGDKRTIVVNGQVLGSAIRLPASGQWVCNVARGGTSGHAVADDDEHRIAAALSEELGKYGIVMFGFDTLIGNHGKRLLSEVNTMSIGGLKQIRDQNNEPILKAVVDQLLFHMHKIWFGAAQ
jgi:glutathione synthase